MSLDDAIAEYRVKAKDCFEWQNYEMARQYAQVADWLEELGRARQLIKELQEEVDEGELG